MINTPTITVAIACYNSQAFIGDALQGLLNQSRPPMEIIVVDDGSTDQSRAVIDALGVARVISHDHNQGIAAARNTAWQNTRGDIVAFLDADAVPHPRFIHELGKCYCDPSMDGVCGQAVERICRTDADRWRSEILFQHWGRHTRRNVPFLFGISASYRRSALAAAGGFDPFFKFSGEDMDLGFRLHQAGRRLMYTPRAVVYHMRRDDRRSVRKMAYRHCYGGFLAQRKNGCFLNKMTPAQSLRLFLRQVIQPGRTKGRLSYAALTIRLHGTILKAWIDARRAHKEGAAGATHDARYCWEGYRSQPTHPLPTGSTPRPNGGA